MADKRWVSTSGDMNSAASYSASGVPGNGDALYFDGSSQMDAFTNMNALSALGAVQTRIWLQAPYQGDIGAEGNPLIADANHFIHQGSGSVYHSIVGGNSPYIVIDSPNLQDAYTIFDTAGAAGATATFAIINGSFRVPDVASTTGIVLGTLLIGPGRTSPPIVDIGFGAFGGSNAGSIKYRQSGGYVTTKIPFGANSSTDRAVIDGGILIYDKSATGVWRRVEITGGRMEFNGGVVGGISMDDCTVSSGILDMTKDSRAKTITKLTLLPGAVFLTHRNITVTTLIDLRDTYPILP